MPLTGGVVVAVVVIGLLGLGAGRAWHGMKKAAHTIVCVGRHSGKCAK